MVSFMPGIQTHLDAAVFIPLLWPPQWMIFHLVGTMADDLCGTAMAARELELRFLFFRVRIKALVC